MLEAAHESAEVLPDAVVQEQLVVIEERLSVRAKAAAEQRQKARRAQERCLRQLLLEDRDLRQGLLQEMQGLWLSERRREVAQVEFIELLNTLKTGKWEAERSRPYELLDVGEKKPTWPSKRPFSVRNHVARGLPVHDLRRSGRAGAWRGALAPLADRFSASAG